MSFFKRHPKFWIAIWSVFGLGGLVMTFNGLFDHGLNAALIVRGVVGVALAGMMIGYLLPEVWKTNAQH